eukprot:TRINITY_DN100505_c0_g1_i1.p1 TRINITY_DN100505_c0_g1~~TRINITY_DN100505_c0_g1_i1.p1  ORF type:complete len:680 (-),score=95.22 TRINITY_DN100505_c0_g1_i1:156-2195(-)
MTIEKVPPPKERPPWDLQVKPPDTRCCFPPPPTAMPPGLPASPAMAQGPTPVNIIRVKPNREPKGKDMSDSPLVDLILQEIRKGLQDARADLKQSFQEMLEDSTALLCNKFDSQGTPMSAKLSNGSSRRGKIVLSPSPAPCVAPPYTTEAPPEDHSRFPSMLTEPGSNGNYPDLHQPGHIDGPVPMMFREGSDDNCSGQTELTEVGGPSGGMCLTKGADVELVSHMGNFRRRKTVGERFVASKGFGIASAILILANTMYLGAQADLAMKAQIARIEDQRATLEQNMVVLLMDVLFLILFTVEVIIRAFCLRGQFFCGPEKYWNMFDCAVVSTSGIEVLMDMLGLTAFSAGLSALRTFRLARIVRLFRLAKSVSAIQSLLRSLQTLLLALGSVASSLLPAIILLCCIVYVFGLLLMEGILVYMAEVKPGDEKAAELVQHYKEYFGSLVETVISLLASVTGGLDWASVAGPLKEVSEAYRLLYLAYVMLVLMGVANLISGLFVSVATSATSLEGDIVMDEAILEHNKLAMGITKIILEADDNGDGTMTWEELGPHLKDERIKAYLNTLQLDVGSVGRIFTLLDNGDGEVPIKDLIACCIDLRGSAKQVDVLTLYDLVHGVNLKMDYFFQEVGCKPYADLPQKSAWLDKHCGQSSRKAIVRKTMRATTRIGSRDGLRAAGQH